MIRGTVIQREAQLISVYTPEGMTLRGIPLGKVRKREKIYAGDRVYGRIQGKEFLIESLEERKNLLPRPVVANVDIVLLITTIREPEFNNFLLDNLLLVYEFFLTKVILVFNKIDLLSAGDLEELKRWEGIYRGAGYEVLRVSARKMEGIEELKEHIKGDISILAGASGVGKSSILSRLTGYELRTKEVSKKTGRGRHTTTGVKLIPFNRSSFIGDTPGFSKVKASLFLPKERVKDFFREFSEFQCRYPDCSHTSEPDCGVKEALERGIIPEERYRSYVRILETYKED